MKILVSFLTNQSDIAESKKNKATPVGPAYDLMQILPGLQKNERPDKLYFLVLTGANSKDAQGVLEYCDRVGIAQSQVIFLNAYKHLKNGLNDLKGFAEVVGEALLRIPEANSGRVEWWLFMERGAMLLSWAFFHFALAHRPFAKLLAFDKRNGQKKLGFLDGAEVTPEIMSDAEKRKVKRLQEREVPLPAMSREEAFREGNLKLDSSTIEAYASAECVATLRDQSTRIPTTLILGESGVGKEDLARYVHKKSEQGKGNFTAMNCAGLSDTLADSLLFGHKAGSFTGAQKDHPGLLETAKGGTLFLDEVGDLSPNVQTKLLRVLQERKFHRLGEEGILRNCDDVRFVFATCKIEGVVPGRDREVHIRRDLFERIAQYQLFLRPLRERPRELEYRGQQLLMQFKELDKADYVLPEDWVDRLIQTGLDGNFRELDRRFRAARLQCRVSNKTDLNVFLFEEQNQKILQKENSAKFTLDQTPETVFARNSGRIAKPYPLKKALDRMRDEFLNELYELTQSKPKAAKMAGYHSPNSVR